MIYSSVLKNAAGQGANGNLDKLRVSAGQETDEVKNAAMLLPPPLDLVSSLWTS